MWCTCITLVFFWAEETGFHCMSFKIRDVGNNGTGMSGRTSLWEVQPVLRRLNQDLEDHQNEKQQLSQSLFSLWGHTIFHLLHPLAFLSRRPCSAPSSHGPGSTMISALLPLSLNSGERGSEQLRSWARCLLLCPIHCGQRGIKSHHKTRQEEPDLQPEQGVGPGAALKQEMYTY